MARPDTAEPRAKTLLGSLRASEAKCCLCRNIVLRSGWCDTCNCWPITLYPVRWCEQGHRLDPDGFCWTCHDYFATQLLPAKGAWEDTGYVPKLLSREENQRRMRWLMQWLDSGQPSLTLIPHCEEMERKEPGIGWKKAAEDLRAWNARLKRPTVTVRTTPDSLMSDRTPTQLPREVLDRQKQILLRMNGMPAGEEVPF